jgi:hypothetical protein
MKKNLPLIIAFSLPILMVILVIGLVYVPTATYKSNYNFIYATGADYYWPSHYEIKNNQLVKNSESPHLHVVHNNEQLYLYNVTTEQVSPIDYNKAQKLRLDPKPISPDGFQITHATGDHSFFSLFFFSSPSYNARFLQKNHFSRRLNLKLNGQFYNNFQFIGWVLDGKTDTAR